MRVAKNTKSNETVVIKYYKKTGEECYDNKSKCLVDTEYNILSKVSHENIVKCIEAGESEVISGDSKDEVYFIAYEYLPGGNLFDFVQQGLYSEGLACFIFEELVKTVVFLNTQGYAHLDLKLENIMIDKNGKLKLIDFGFASKLCGKKGNGKIQLYAGTIPYKAPEISKCKPFSGFSADVFSMGIILFCLISKAFPFDEAKKKDSFFKPIKQERYDIYWEKVSESGGFFQPLLRNLLNGMFSPNPLTRITTPEILEHSWIKETVKPTESEARKLIKAICHLT